MLLIPAFFDGEPEPDLALLLLLCRAIQDFTYGRSNNSLKDNKKTSRLVNGNKNKSRKERLTLLMVFVGSFFSTWYE